MIFFPCKLWSSLFNLKYFFALQSLVRLGKQLSFLHDSLEIKNCLENLKDIQKCKLFSLSMVNQLEQHFVCMPLESVQQSYSLTYCCAEMFTLLLGTTSTSWNNPLTVHPLSDMLFLLAASLSKGLCLLHFYTLSVRL